MPFLPFCKETQDVRMFGIPTPTSDSISPRPNQIFRSRPGHRSTLTIPNKPKKDEDATKGEAQAAEEEEKALPGMTAPGSTGVIYVMGEVSPTWPLDFRSGGSLMRYPVTFRITDRASANGFTYENEEWANLGQVNDSKSPCFLPHRLH